MTNNRRQILQLALTGLAAGMPLIGRAQNIETLKIISGFAADSLVAQARLSKALIHESQKQYSEAIALYDEVSKEATSMAAQEASAHKAALLQAHPELTSVATNAPAVKPVH